MAEGPQVGEAAPDSELVGTNHQDTDDLAAALAALQPATAAPA